LQIQEKTHTTHTPHIAPCEWIGMDKYRKGKKKKKTNNIIINQKNLFLPSFGNENK